jgi:hypothetical protein
MSNNLIGELGKANNEIGRMHPGADQAALGVINRPYAASPRCLLTGDSSGPYGLQIFDGCLA